MRERRSVARGGKAPGNGGRPALFRPPGAGVCGTRREGRGCHGLLRSCPPQCHTKRLRKEVFSPASTFPCKLHCIFSISKICKMTACRICRMAQGHGRPGLLQSCPLAHTVTRAKRPDAHTPPPGGSASRRRTLRGANRPTSLQAGVKFQNEKPLKFWAAKKA